MIMALSSWAVADGGPDDSPYRGSPWRGIPSAHTVEESHRYLSQRADAVVWDVVGGSLGPFDRENGRRMTVKALAWLEKGNPAQIAEVNLAFLDPKAVPFALPGVDFDRFGAVCGRKGDYDFTLVGLAIIASRYWNDPVRLWPETREKLLKVLLTETGNRIEKTRWFKLCGWWPETENHILLTEVSQYITNQLWLRWFAEHGGHYVSFYDNQRNGMNRFFLEHLQQFLKSDFYEYNSKPYQKLTVWALTALFEYAEDEQVKTSTRLVLDYLAAKYAVSSKSSRRSAPFRRQPHYRENPDLLSTDSESLRFLLLAGNLDFVQGDSWPEGLDVWPQIFEALSSYRVPEMILDLILRDEDEGRTFWQGFHHTGWEIYAGSPSFLISGGGRWVNDFDYWTGELSGWAVPVVVIPARGGISRENMIRFEGAHDDRKKNNQCVAPGFACGINPVIPDSISPQCRWKPAGNSPWTFLDFTRPDCAQKWGFFAAIYQAPCETRHCRRRGESWGFAEMAEVEGRSFEQFRIEVLRRNSGRSFHEAAASRYVTSRGVEVVFTADPASRAEWGIRSVDGVNFDSDDSHWPLVWGNLLQTKGDGRVVVRNPWRGQELVLDARDAVHPSWELKKLNSESGRK
jgi:hypothetical protein